MPAFFQAYRMASHYMCAFLIKINIKLSTQHSNKSFNPKDIFKWFVLQSKDKTEEEEEEGQQQQHQQRKNKSKTRSIYKYI